MNGYRFLLPNGQAVETIPLAEVGGLMQTVNADEVAALRAVAHACRMLTGLCLFQADPHAFANGVTACGVDEGEAAGRRIVDEAERALTAAGGPIGCREPGAAVYEDPFG